MTFYRSDPKMQAKLQELLDVFAKQSRPNLHANISITWIRYESQNPSSGRGIGAGWLEHKMIYPASVVKLIYSVASEIWLEKNLILDCPELRRALHHMIAESSNDATSYIVDLLTGTTSGPSLKGNAWIAWKKQRNLINTWLKSLGWPEFKNTNCCQKTWNDGPYGRDKDFYGIDNDNRNSLSTSGTARFLEALMTNDLLSSNGSIKVKRSLSRSLEVLVRKATPENQIDGFIGEGLPISTNFWSKAGLMSSARHDAAWWIRKEGTPMLLVIFTEGKALSNDTFLLPAISSELNKWHPSS